MQLRYHPHSLQHDTGHHPEHIERLTVLANHFQLSPSSISDPSAYLPLVHSAAYIERIRAACAQGAAIDGDTQTSVGSWEAALAGVSLSMQAAEHGDFALVRPPGHHAHADRTGGFCLFNNIAIATQRLVEEDGKRVAIIDIDGHCGDGTASIFYESDQVLVLSVHQYPAFPATGFINELGAGKGLGNTIHVPLPPGAADDILLDALQHFLPIVEQFAPDTVGISAGFDGHWADPLLQLNYSDHGFFQTGELLRNRFPHLFAVLEGGYNREALPGAVDAFLAGINNAPHPGEPEATISGLRVWETYEANAYAALSKLRDYWKVH